MICKHVYFSGRVQGVGFRYTAIDVAHNYEVTGFVRNLPDGRVEMITQGKGPTVDAFINALCERMNRYIRETYINEEPLGDDFNGFSIRH